jgi:hypothetical protein
MDAEEAMINKLKVNIIGGCYLLAGQYWSISYMLKRYMIYINECLTFCMWEINK